MLAAQRIYGPDGETVLDLGEIAIGRCLFRLLPEDIHDRGAVASPNGRYQLVGDARLDNRDELARALDIASADAVCMSDATFLVQAWERWEESSFERLYGEYAFALWDALERRLILARDHLGTRPLHFHRGRDFVAFASMPKGLHALPEVPYAPDEIKVAELTALIPEQGVRSFFQDICRVEGGHYVVITRERTVSRRHWDPAPVSLGQWRGGDAAEAMRAHLDDAVFACLRGVGGNVGAHLSAGMDSSAVTATAARLMEARGGRVTAFTAVPRAGYSGSPPPGRIADESTLARATAGLYSNIDHILIAGDGRSITDGWDRAFFLLDRPLLNPCNDLWWTAINVDASRRGLSVMLTGEMGNMTISFAGLELLPELWRKWAWPGLWREARALVRSGNMRWRGVFAATLGPWMPEKLWIELQRRRSGSIQQFENYTAMRRRRIEELRLAHLAAERGLDPSYRPRRDAFESRLWVLRRFDKGNFQKAALAGHGIDQRDPTIDRRLIEFCLSLPTSEFLRDGETRALGKRALADRLPEDVLAERRKGYQAVDWHEGLCAARGQLAEELGRLEDLPAVAGLLDLERLQSLLVDMPDTGWETRNTIEKYRLALLRGGAVAHFLRRASRTNL
ncbi:MAG: asparagine synthase-related protein [Sphingomonas sp.]|uniref:asparagine synthetase B family protein n=1 Tax=Sphingomonas sp. TaxID=28214 RepID=UPI0022742D9F|nr:asparagine synthase-related protein [Sphingomonas sp.]MCX8477813.1 asparagine synthase-related protein [Sphingomonas sp.]